MRYQIQINFGGNMKIISNSTVNELIRLLPVLIDSIPPGQSLRVQNAIRIVRNILKKLNKLKDQE